VQASSRRAGTFSAALSHRDFRRLAAGLAVSTAGNWLYNVALLVYVFERTHSASWVAAASIIRLAPFVVFGPLGGALADRVERRSLMIASDLARAVLMLCLALAAARTAPPALVLAIAFLSTTAGTPYNPAVGAVTPALVPESDLAAANAVARTLDNVAIVAGVGLALGWRPHATAAGAAWAVLLVAGLFALVHAPQYWANAGVIAAITLLSLTLTLVRAQTGRLLPCIIVHCLFNGVSSYSILRDVSTQHAPQIPAPTGLLLVTLSRIAGLHF